MHAHSLYIMGWFLKLWNAFKKLLPIQLRWHISKSEKNGVEMREFPRVEESFSQEFTVDGPYTFDFKIKEPPGLDETEEELPLPIEVDDETLINISENKEELPLPIEDDETLINISETKEELPLPIEVNKEPQPSPVEEFFNKQLQIVEKHIQIINVLNTTPEVKNVLIKYEENNRKKYDNYTELIKDEKNSRELRKIFGDHFNSLHHESCGEVYDETFRSNMTSLAELYKNNGNDRHIVDLFNEMEDFVDEKNTRLLIEDNPRFARSGGFSTYQVMPYQERVSSFSKDLEELQNEPKKFQHLYGVNCDITNLVLYHAPVYGEDFTTYRDVVNNLEYIKLYNGLWQISKYDS